MAVKIVVLSDGTWETVSGVQVLTLTEDAFQKLVDGEAETCDLKDGEDILETKDVDGESVSV